MRKIFRLTILELIKALASLFGEGEMITAVFTKNAAVHTSSSTVAAESAIDFQQK